jgi:hypothetical protein
MKSEGFVYFIENQESSLIKIGFSTDVDGRLKTLRTAAPNLRLIGFIPGTVATESWLHRKFATSRVDREWFAAGDLRCFIESVGVMTPIPPTLAPAESLKSDDRPEKNAAAQALVKLRNKKLSPERRAQIASAGGLGKAAKRKGKAA